MSFALLAVAIAQQASALITSADYFYSQNGRPLVVGHRGSLGHFPEHTIAGYTDAWLLGTDWVELDLQMSKDGVLIVNHDECMKSSTDAEIYDSLWKQRERTVAFTPSGNICTNDFMFIDFTIAEIKMVKRRQRFSYRSTATDGFFQVPTFEEAIQHMIFMRDNYSRRVGTDTVPGLYIEMKEP
jgi:glycerophosphoryl diester phosphodiesterase